MLPRVFTVPVVTKSIVSETLRRRSEQETRSVRGVTGSGSERPGPEGLNKVVGGHGWDEAETSLGYEGRAGTSVG